MLLGLDAIRDTGTCYVVLVQSVHLTSVMCDVGLSADGQMHAVRVCWERAYVLSETLFWKGHMYSLYFNGSYFFLNLTNLSIMIGRKRLK